jgi:hypothetical protein
MGTESQTASQLRGSGDNAEIVLAHWPTVDAGSIPKEFREQFLRRRNAVRLYVEGVRGQEIKAKTGLTIQEVSKLINNRCLIVHGDGRIYGYRGLIPHLRTKNYQRSLRVSIAVPASGYTTGAFTQLLRYRQMLWMDGH